MKFKKLNMAGFTHDMFLIIFVVVFAIAGAGYLVASHADTCTPSVSSSCPPVSGPVSGPTLAPGEQLSVPPQRRPAQYVHQCVVNGAANSPAANYYVTQGSPNCLSNDTFTGNYPSSASGTGYNVPCETTTGALLRYVYISGTESCPHSTAPQALGPGEQLSIPPQPRPAQYVHLCTAAVPVLIRPGISSVAIKQPPITYIAQGAPNCLTNGVFQYNAVPGFGAMVFNIPCKATAGTYLRYGYISKSETCPTGTASVTPQG